MSSEESVLAEGPKASGQVAGKWSRHKASVAGVEWSRKRWKMRSETWVRGLVI